MKPLDIPRFGELLAPFIRQVPPEATPLFLALLERGAANRYRLWSDMLPAHAERLLTCAAAEDEIADRIEGAFALAAGHHDVVQAALPGALAAYAAAFADLDAWDQLRIQANAERQGAHAWRSIASRTSDTAVLEALAACSALEEASADLLDTLIGEFAPPR